jgi:hypothetical protein
VALPLTSASAFHSAFADALVAALTDLDVDAGQIAIEASAVKPLPLRYLRDAALRERLDTMDFMYGIELSYSGDLRVLQRRLNAFPSDLPPGHVPEVAIAQLFAQDSVNGRSRLH